MIQLLTAETAKVSQRGANKIGTGTLFFSFVLSFAHSAVSFFLI